ncbi:MAG: type IA DNA topoisomerase, partial [Lachnospiraceae bacterium]|nr:type IA DNA topoisomerase [Lachnospiraceae bacterium]
MGKSLFIAEKPSVAEEFAKVVEKNLSRYDGYREGPGCVVTWCFGHLITMSYPEVYDARLKKWRLDTLPFLPE